MTRLRIDRPRSGRRLPRAGPAGRRLGRSRRASGAATTCDGAAEGVDLVVHRHARRGRGRGRRGRRARRRATSSWPTSSGSLGLAPLAGHLRRAVAAPAGRAARPRAGGPPAWPAPGSAVGRRRPAGRRGGRGPRRPPLLVADADWAALPRGRVIASNHLVALLGQVERVAGERRACRWRPSSPWPGPPSTTWSRSDRPPRSPARCAAATGATVERHLAALPDDERAAYAAAVRRRRPGLCPADDAWPRSPSCGPARRGPPRRAARRARADDGLPPRGHVSLMRAARADTDVVVTSIFVNPLQFGPTRTSTATRGTSRATPRWPSARASTCCFVPTVAEMYPGGPSSRTCRVREARAPPRGPHAGRRTSTAWPRWSPSCSPSSGPCRAYFGREGLPAARRGAPPRPTCRSRSRWSAARRARARRPRHVEPQRLPVPGRAGRRAGAPPGPPGGAGGSRPTGTRDPAVVRAAMAGGSRPSPSPRSTTPRWSTPRPAPCPIASAVSSACSWPPGSAGPD